jgi:hypothetical protein
MTIEKSRFNSEAAPQSNACQKDILAVTESDISVIRFEGKKVRIVNWTVIRGLLPKTFARRWSYLITMAIAALDDDEKG